MATPTRSHKRPAGDRVGPLPMLFTAAGFWLTLLALGVLRLVAWDHAGWSILGLILGMSLGLIYQLNRKRLWVRPAARLEAFVRSDPILCRMDPARLTIVMLMIWPIVLAVRWRGSWRSGG